MSSYPMVPNKDKKKASRGPARPSTAEKATQFAKAHLIACVRVTPKGRKRSSGNLASGVVKFSSPLHM